MKKTEQKAAREITCSQGNALPGGTFGLERETLRVTAEGNMAHTPHPFPDDKNIVKDFCENQAEINTGVHNSAGAALKELAELSNRLSAEIEKRGEALWLYSNPPLLKNADDIPVAVYEGEQKDKYLYRLYLAEKYGKNKMTLSGIHVNYSLSEKMFRLIPGGSAQSTELNYKNQTYLRLAQGLLEYGWIINLLLSASPVCDGSYFSAERAGETVITDYASLRCGKEGYWNNFTPILFYDNITAYTGSIQRYVNSGTLKGASELYYPIRLKPKGANDLLNLVKNGVNHIELRNIDINPFSETGLDERDLEFIELLILWIVAEYREKLTYKDQIRVTENLKNAALYDIDSAAVYSKNNKPESARTAGLRLLDELKAFYGDNPVLNYQYRKLSENGIRYAEKIRECFHDNRPLDFITPK